MKLFPLLLLALSLSICSCGTHTSTTGKIADSTHVANTELPQRDFYKRYAGTIAGRQVVANITRYGNVVSGTYQYTGISQVIDLSPDSASGSFIRMIEFAPRHASDLPDSAAHWEVEITADGISGKWTSAGGLRTEAIQLKEEYPEGSYRMDAIARQDSLHLLDGRTEPHATASYTAIFAQGNNPAAAFINNKLREAIGLPAEGEAAPLMESALRKYFDTYRKETLPLLKNEHDTAQYWMYNYSQDEALNVLYNDRGFLIVQNFMSDYTGGVHGNYASSYLNIDVSGNKVWNLKDVVEDTASLAPLLNLAARNYFGIANGDAMDDMMLVSEVPVTNNFFLTPEGLTFVYNPYEIASYADGAIQLYLPYKKLMSLLTPAFKERLHLGASSGVALRNAFVARRTFEA